MLFLIAIIIAGLFSYFCADALRKKPIPFYIAGTVLSVLMIVLNQTHVRFSDFTNTYLIGLFNRGVLAAALWCIVAWVGALPDEAKNLRKKLLPARGELSIFAALITLSHAVVYGISYVRRLFSGRAPESDFLLTCIVCLLLMLIMIPLTVISFKAIRKKMNAKKWKTIQRTAYVFYTLIYLHIMLILVPRAQQGREGVLFSIIVYTIVFVGYAVFRIRKVIIKNKKPQRTAPLNAACAAVVIAFTGIMGITSRASEQPVQTAETVSQVIPETTAAVSSTETATETKTETQAETKSQTEFQTETQTETNSETASETNAESQTETQAETKSETQTETPKTTETSAVTETSAPAETSVQEQTPENQPVQEEQSPVQEQTPEPVQEEQIPQEAAPEPEPEPEIMTVYNDGVYTVTKFGYDSDVVITVTIQNDVITDVSASCNESDMYYFDVAYPVLRDAILNAQSPDVDAVSGSTYSSDAIRDGVREALNQARK